MHSELAFASACVISALLGKGSGSSPPGPPNLLHEKEMLQVWAESLVARNACTSPEVCAFRVDAQGKLADNVDTMARSIDISSQKKGSLEPLQRLRDAGLGAFFRPAQVEQAGLTRDQLRTLVRRGNVEHVARGLYRLADAEPTEDYSLAMVCARVPEGVICLLSALRVHGIGTQSPPAVWLAIHQRARTPRVEGVRIRVVRFSAAAWTLGISRTQFEGVPARITDPARTVLDCFRFERLIGPETPIEALQDALGQRKTTVAELARLEETLPARRLRAALDVRSI
ncbi:MAG: hypothetical protein GF330_12290 [Candidatus Eisenbacteria bacterium]|nr:hypothetical protein [Candidatus Eisenbacteria bacterium]